MSISPDEAVGPVDFILLEFPVDRMRGEVAAAVLDLVDQGTIRLLDVMVLAKEDDGSVSALTMEDARVGGILGELSGAVSGLLDEEDMTEAAEALEPGTVAALLVYENTWAAPFVAAVRRGGGEVVASGRIPASDLMDALDSAESAS